jgi:hypothetical protein
MPKTGYKVLSENGEACKGGSGQWFLPIGKGPGKWMPAISDIALCKRGYHICRGETDLLAWLGPTIWNVEYRGKVKIGDDKIVVEEARLLSQVKNWNEQTARLFAADCAERVLHHIPEKHRAPFTNAVAVARDFANGKATDKARAAAGDAAWAAAGAAAGDAAGAAAWAAARAAAWAAARAAAWAAAWDAARAAARAAEKRWQAKRLKKYLDGKIKLLG